MAKALEYTKLAQQLPNVINPSQPFGQKKVTSEELASAGFHTTSRNKQERYQASLENLRNNKLISLKQ